jgi:trans-aconitate methyltransferase
MAGSLNHWLTPDGSPLKELLLRRYRFAAGFVSGHVLDWACGYGLGTSLLVNIPGVTSIHAMDVDPDAWNYARKRVQDSRIMWALGDMDEFPMCPADWLVSCETLEHLCDPFDFLARAKQQMRQGIVLSVPIWPTVGKGNKDHRHDFTVADIEWTFRMWRRLDAQILDEHRPRDGKLAMQYLLTAYAKE